MRQRECPFVSFITHKKRGACAGAPLFLYSDGLPYEKRVDAKGRESEPVCIADEVPFEVPEGWCWARLEQVCSDILVPQRDKPTRFDGDVPWCRIEDIEGSVINGSKTGKHVSNATIASMNLKVNPVGTVICSNSATIGVPAVVTTPLVTNQRFIGFVCGEALYNWYLYYLFIANHSYLSGAGTGTTQSYIARSTFAQLLVPLPPLAEQRRIVAKVEELMPLVEQYGALEDERERLDAALPNALRKSILQEAVEGRLVPQDASDEPASALLVRIREERRKMVADGKLRPPKGGESVIFAGSDGRRYEKRVDAKGRESEPVCIEDEIPFEVPEGWEWARLGALATFTGGGTPDKGNPAYWNGGIPWASMKDIHGNILNETIDSITEEGLASKPSISMCQPGQIIVSTRLVPGKAIVSNIKCAINQDLKVVNTSLPTEYLSIWFASHLTEFKRIGSGTTVPGIKLSDLESALVPLPPISEQHRIANKVNELLDLITSR